LPMCASLYQHNCSSRFQISVLHFTIWRTLCSRTI